MKFFMWSIAVFSFVSSCVTKEKFAIECISIKDSFAIKKNTKLIIPLKLINPDRLLINLGSFVPEDNGQGGECLPTEYNVLYKSPSNIVYSDYILEITRTQAQFSKNRLHISKGEQVFYTYIPDALYQVGDYKFQFILRYSIGEDKAVSTIKTQWIDIKVLE